MSTNIQASGDASLRQVVSGDERVLGKLQVLDSLDDAGQPKLRSDTPRVPSARGCSGATSREA